LRSGTAARQRRDSRLIFARGFAQLRLRAARKEQGQGKAGNQNGRVPP
jgi:hypothetical protein